jgi:Flp pilus assembly protein TadG
MARTDRGAVTAEAALVLPLLVGLTLALVWLLSLAGQQVRVVDAAREAARAAARGDPDSVAIERALVAAPGASVTVSHADGEVAVTVTSRVSGPGGGLAALAGELSARAVAAEEGGE